MRQILHRQSSSASFRAQPAYVMCRASPCARIRSISLILSARPTKRPVTMRLSAPAADRNKSFILDVLKTRLSGQGLVLEIASGTGQHVEHFARGLPSLTFQPTECRADTIGSISAHTEGLHNVRQPILLDAAAPDTWSVEEASCSGVICINMTHISPWAATQGLFRGASRVLKVFDGTQVGGLLVIYGPFLVCGRFTSESNAAFNSSLRAQNPAWGYRDVEDLQKLGNAAGLMFQEKVEMPANNLTLVFKRE